MPITMITAKISRRTSRSRVVGDRRQLADATAWLSLLAAPREGAVDQLGDRRRRARCTRPQRSNRSSRRLLCRTRLPAWPMKLPPRQRAHSPRVRGSAALRAPGACSGRPGWQCSWLRVRRPLLRSCGRRAGGRERGQVRHPALTHALADPLLSPLARWDAVWYLRDRARGYAGRPGARRVLPALPARGARAGDALRRGAGALLAAAYVVALGAFLGALTLL